MQMTSSCLAHMPSGPFRLMYRMYRHILPGVKTELRKWRDAAARIPDPELQQQAIASMTSKRFHCEGGAVYATGNKQYRKELIVLIVALQTISDYLDNLCDRSTSLDADDFRMLHQAMLDAVDPFAPIQDYYALHEEKDDGGYLQKLVETCQSCVLLLPSYPFVKQYVKEFAGLYSDLQVYKHIHPQNREQALFAWWDQHKEHYPDIEWNEFSAATGSTLGMFMLFVAATDEHITLETVKKIRNSYFPAICGLHILLDYLIDQEEDLHGGDLNFCSYYSDQEMTINRIQYFADEAKSAVKRLPSHKFHVMIVDGLLALYLSDPKVKGQQRVRHVSHMLMRHSPWTRVFFWLNSKWIRSRAKT